MSSPDLCPNAITFQSAAKAATRLNLLYPDHFPIPKFVNEATMTAPNTPGPLFIARPQQQFSILPAFSLQNLAMPMTLENGRFDLEGVRADTELEYMRLAQEARKAVSEAEGSEDLDDFPGREVEVIPLGTGSAMPSKYRNGRGLHHHILLYLLTGC